MVPGAILTTIPKQLSKGSSFLQIHCRYVVLSTNTIGSIKLMAQKRSGNTHRRRRATNLGYDFKPDMLYLDGRVSDTLPGTRFIVKVDRDAPLDPLFITADVRTLFKTRRSLTLIKGDNVTVEIDPTQDLTKGVIVIAKRESYTPPPRKMNR